MTNAVRSLGNVGSSFWVRNQKISENHVGQSGRPRAEQCLRDSYIEIRLRPMASSGLVDASFLDVPKPARKDQTMNKRTKTC
jgi:hypothetical protein